MKDHLNRREFMATSTTAVTGALLGLSCDSQVKKPTDSDFGRALIVNKPTERALTEVKAAGFEGVEAGIMSRAEAEQARSTAESSR